MEIELPDGTILDAPDGANPKTIVQNYKRNQSIAALKRSNPGEYDPESDAYKEKYGSMAGVGTGQRTLEGIGSGMVGMVKKAGNLLHSDAAENGLAELISGPKKDASFFSKDSIEKQKKTDEDLADTTAGKVGQLIGETAITAPIGGAVGAGVKGLAGARALSTAAPVLARALASAPLRAAIEGATVGAISSDPGERGAGALTGGALGGTLSKLGQVGGRILKGAVKKSDAAEDLQLIAEQHGDDIHIPLAQAAGDQDNVTRLVKTIYRSVLPNIPTVEGRLAGQSEKALEKVRKFALDEATPNGVTLPANAAEDVGSTTRTLKAGFDASYDSIVKPHTFRIPSKLSQGMEGYISSKMPGIDSTSLNRAVGAIDSIVDRFRDGNLVVDGANMLNIKTEVGNAIKQTTDRQTKAAMVHGSKVIDGIIKSRLQALGKLPAYEALSEPYRNFKVLQSAAKASKPNRGNFTPATLARRSPDPSDMLHLAQSANETLGQKATRASTAGKILTGMALGGTGYGLGAPAALGLVAGGHVLASPVVQKTLMGDTRVQQAIVRALRRHLKLASRVGQTLRAASTNQGD